MTRFTRYVAVAFLASLTVSSGVHARTANSASDMTVRKQCNEEALRAWGSNSQDMQTARDFLFRACAFDHGMRNP